jgi:hypothetical protein
VNIFLESVWQFNKVVKLAQQPGTASDNDGYFVILNIPPGTYNLKATMMGYRNRVQQQIRVNIDRTTRVDFPLEETMLEGSAVEVVAPREVIKADVSSTQEIILSERISEMPVLRVDEFINKIKGVELVAGNDGQGLSVRCGAIRETDVRLDGISLRDPRSDNSYLSLNSTSVEEVQVLTGGFETRHPRDFEEKYQVGLEYFYQKMFILRSGYMGNYDERGLTAGIGFRQKVSEHELRIDYAFQNFGVFNSVHTFSFGMTY